MCSREFLLLVLLCAFMVSCGEKNDDRQGQTFDLKQLEGRWECIDNRNNQIEEWGFVNSHELKGIGYVLSDQDTTFIEFLSIKELNGMLTYFAQVSDTDAAEVVPFTVSFQSNSRIEFMNNQQDFPKKIGYEVSAENAMQSYIEGPRDGQNIRILFDFEKKP